MTAPATGVVVVGVADRPPEDAARALEFAAQEAALRGVGLRLVHGCEPLATLTAPAPTVSMVERERRGAELLKAAAATAADLLPPETEIQRRVHPGTGAQALLAESHDASLVVLQRRDTSRLHRFHTGSTTSRFTARAGCPVMVVRRAHRQDAGRRGVVVGVDDSGHAQVALRVAFAEAELRNAALTAVHAWQSQSALLPADMPLDARDLRDLRERAQLDLAEALAGYASEFPGVPVSASVVDASVIEALVTAAAQAELLVVGRHGTGPLGPTALGSVARHCLDSAPCPVIITPPSRRPRHESWLMRGVEISPRF